MKPSSALPRGRVTRNRTTRRTRAAKRVAPSRHWLAQNQRAIEQYNAFVEQHGVFGDEYRSF